MTIQKLNHPIKTNKMGTRFEVQEAHNLLDKCIERLTMLQHLPEEITDEGREVIEKELTHLVVDLIRGLDRNHLLRKSLREVQDKDIFTMESIP